MATFNIRGCDLFFSLSSGCGEMGGGGGKIMIREERKKRGGGEEEERVERSVDRG